MTTGRRLFLLPLLAVAAIALAAAPAMGQNYSTGAVSTANPQPSNGWYRTLAWNSPGTLTMTMAATKAMSNQADDALGTIYGNSAYNNWGSNSPLIPANMAAASWSGIASSSNPYTPTAVQGLKGLSLGFYTPEVCAGVPAPSPGNPRTCDGGTLTFTFARPVQNAVFHFADAGAGDNPGGVVQSTCPTFNVTGGLTLTLLSSAGNVASTSTSVRCASRVSAASPSSSGQGYVSMRVNGTYSSVTFNVPVTWWTTTVGGGSANFLDGMQVLWSVPSDAPTAVNDSATTPMNTPVTLSSLSNDTGNALQITGFNATSAKGGTVTRSGNDFVYTPPAGFAGTDTFSYTVTDSFGRTRTATGTITVPAPPPTTVADQAYGEQGRAITLSPLANDSPGSTLLPLVPGSMRICTAGTPAASCNQTSLTVNGEGTYTVNPNGTVTLTPVPGFVGTSSISYVAVDSSPTPQKAVGSMATTLLPPPATSASADAVTAPQFRQPVSVDPLANDSAGTTDPALLPGYNSTGGAVLDPASVFLCGDNETPPQCTQSSKNVTGVGMYTLNQDKTITFTPDPAYSGTAPGVKYVVCNTLTPTWAPVTPSSTCASSTYTPTIPPPAPPVASADDTTTPWNTPVPLTPRANDTRDPLLTWGAIGLCDGSDCTNSTVTIDGEGTYTLANDGTVTFTPVASFAGTSTLRYAVRDELGQDDQGVMTVVVQAPPAPTADAQNRRAKPGEQVVFSPVRTGTQLTTTLCDGNDCSKTSLTVTGEGTYEVNGDGTVTFTSEPGFEGVSSVSYQVSDAIGQTRTALLTATISNAPPPALDDPVAQVPGVGGATPGGTAGQNALAPRLAITTRASRTTLRPGQRSLITLRVSNRGGATAMRTVTRAPIPKGFAVANPMGGTVRGGWIWFTTGNLKAGGGTTRRFVLVATSAGVGQGNQHLTGWATSSNTASVNDPIALKVIGAVSRKAPVTG